MTISTARIIPDGFAVTASERQPRTSRQKLVVSPHCGQRTPVREKNPHPGSPSCRWVPNPRGSGVSHLATPKTIRRHSTTPASFTRVFVPGGGTEFTVSLSDMRELSVREISDKRRPQGSPPRRSVHQQFPLKRTAAAFPDCSSCRIDSVPNLINVEFGKFRRSSWPWCTSVGPSSSDRRTLILAEKAGKPSDHETARRSGCPADSPAWVTAPKGSAAQFRRRPAASPAPDCRSD